MIELIFRDQIKRCLRHVGPFGLTSSKDIGLFVKNSLYSKNVAFPENEGAKEHWDGLDKNKRVHDKAE